MTKYFLLSSCLLMATVSALAQQFPMDQFMGINLRREDPVARLKCVGFVREYHDWAVDEGNAYNNPDLLHRDTFPFNRYSWNLQQATAIKFDDFYQEMLSNLNHTSGRPPICATMKQCLPYLAGGDTYGTYSELKPVRYDSSGRRKPELGFSQNDKPLNYRPLTGWSNTSSYIWIADWLYQFTRRYGAGVDTLSNIKKLKTDELDRKNLNKVGYIELWNEPNKYWIKNYGDATDVSWLRATQFTGGEYAAMASTTYDAHRTTIDLTDPVTQRRYKPGVRSADNSMKFVMGGSAGIREYDWNFLQDIKTWFDNNRIDTALRSKYPFDVINFHHYNSNRWFGLAGQVSLPDYAASPEEDRWKLGSRVVNYAVATTATGYEKEDSARAYNGILDLNPRNSTQRTFKQRLVELRYRVDSLFGRRPVELWMSEFGFDTNEKSPYKVPTIAQNGTFADQQEVQARFMMRAYLEIAAAKWDRAMQYDFRDEQSEDGSLFQGSGLLKDKESNYAPKKSYYSVYTMKEALKGTKFRSEIKVGNDPTFTTDAIFGGHSYWFKDTTYHRLMRFAKDGGDARNAGEVVYVAWLPTKSNATKDSVRIYLQPSDVNATQATLVSVSVGDINGVRKPLYINPAGNYVTVNLTEVPLFIRLGESFLDPDLLPPTISAVTGVSCDAIRVQLNTSVPANGFRVYYYERPKSEWENVPTTLDIANPFIKLYADEMKCSDFVITGLKLPHNEYKIFVVAVDGNATVSPATVATVSTTSCFNNYVPIASIESLGSRDSMRKQLFDYGTTDFCYPLRKGADNTYNYLKEWDTFRQDSLEFTLTQNYQLDAISFLEGSGAGLFEIKVMDSNSNILQILSYTKTGFDEWKTLSLCGVNARKLRFIKSPTARMRKIILKGKPATGDYKVLCCGSNDSLLGLPVTRVTTNTNTSSFHPTTYSGTFEGVMRVENCILTVDRHFTIKAGSKIYMSGPNAQIAVGPIAFTIEGSNIRGCDNLWKGIVVDSGGHFTMSNSQLRDAEIGVDFLRNGRSAVGLPSKFVISNSVFEDNVVGINMVPKRIIVQGKDIDSSSNIWSCRFDGNFRDLKVPTTDLARRRSLIGCGLHSFRAAISIGGGSENSPNVFNDLAHGIETSNSSLALSNTIFKHIQVKRTLIDGAVVDYGGNAFFAENTFFNFTGKFDKPIFEKVKNGFLLDHSNFSISRGQFTTEGDYVLKSNFAEKGDAIFANNHVTTLNGSALQIWKAGGSVSLLNNNIDCGNSNRPVDAISVNSWYHRSAPIVLNTEVFMISDTIRGVNAPRSAIISLGMVREADIRRNILNFNSYEGRDTNASVGIKLNMVENSLVRKNQINGNKNDTFRYSPGQIGILSTNSRQDSIYCNTIDGARIGMRFQFNNAPGLSNEAFGAVAGNILKKYNIGLQVDNFAFIGEQKHHRNEWESPDPLLYTIDALLENSNISRQALSRFKVEQRYLPRLVTPDWFFVETATTGFDCRNAPGIIGTSGTTGSGVYSSIADSSYQMYTEDPDAYVWMLEKQAYEEFADLPPTAQTVIMQTFLTSKQGSELETFYRLKKGFESLFQADPNRAARLQELTAFMKLWGDKKAEANNQWVHEDVQIGEKSQEYFDLTAIEKQATLDKAQALLQLNGTLPDEIADFLSKNTGKFQRPYVFYEKVLNRLYLSKIIEGSTVYTEKEQAIVKKIAMMCPLIAGEAPLKARTLYKHFIHPEALPEANCENVPKRVPSIRIPNTYKVYPNPTTGLLSIASDRKIGHFDWKLCTVTGAVLKTGHANDYMDTIDMSDLVNGMYLMQVTQQGYQPTLLKIVIMK